MSRLSIELTPQQHQRLKAMAALQGKSIKQYVLERTLPEWNTGEDEALRQLEDFLQPRVEEAIKGDLSSRTPMHIFEDVQKSIQ